MVFCHWACQAPTVDHFIPYPKNLDISSGILVGVGFRANTWQTTELDFKCMYLEHSRLQNVIISKKKKKISFIDFGFLHSREGKIHGPLALL